MNKHNSQEIISEENIVKVTNFVIENIGNQDIVRRFDGGINLMIGWIPRLPSDIDIRTNKHGYEIFKEKFSVMTKKEWNDEKKKMHYIIFDIQWIEVEVAYYDESENYMDMFDVIIKKTRNNMTVPVLSLEHMKQFYEWIWATGKVELIANFLI